MSVRTLHYLSSHSGSAIALTTSFILLPLLLVAYIWWRGLHHRTWGGWSWESLRDWGQFVRLAVPGLLMVCCEQWCFEISAILTGAIDEVQLGINSVMIQLLSSTFQVSHRGRGLPCLCTECTNAAHRLWLCCLLSIITRYMYLLFNQYYPSSNIRAIVQSLCTCSV